MKMMVEWRHAKLVWGIKGSIALGIYKKACEADHLDPFYFMKLKQRKMQVSEMTKECRNVNKWR
jgi:hypothetical protein